MATVDRAGRLAGRTAIVTGAASGIGRATALAFAVEGAAVLAADIDGDGAAQTAADARAVGSHAEWRRLDVADEAEANRCVEEFVTRRGRIDALVNCAGIVRSGTAGECDLATWSLILGVNLTGLWLMCRAALPHMVAQREGSIVNIASVGALVASPANAAYIASKGGVAALTKSIAIDYAQHNVRANAICPGTVPTPLVINHYIRRGEADPENLEKGLAMARERYPLKRHGAPEEIAALAVYLAAQQESGFMTGALLPIDGGISAAAWQPGQ